MTDTYFTSFLRSKIFLCFVTLPLLLPLTPNALAGDRLVTSVGKTRTLVIKNVARASISDSTLANIETSSKRDKIMITGLNVGKTDMTVWFSNGRKDSYALEVVESFKDIEHELSRLLGGIEGLKIKNTSDGVSLEGEMYRSEDLERIQKILRNYPEVHDFTKINSQALEYFQKVLQQKMLDERFDQIQISKAGNTLYMEGFVRSSVEKIRAEKIAKEIFVETESHIEVGVEQKNLILVDLKFTEVSKRSLQDLGIKWPQPVDVNAAFTSSGKAVSTVLSTETTVQLNSLIDKGDAKILSNPQLLCQSGFPATFDAGGEIPIRLVSERTANVQFKSYGLHLDIKARSDAGKYASIEIQSRMSDINMATAIDGIPGFLEHKVSTAVNLKLGQTVALAGLYESRRNKNTQKVAFLGHIPILGELFKSRNFQNNESEFMVFLTPMLANGADQYHQEKEKRNDRQIQQKEQDLKFSFMD